mgnify:CR=1 FL=1
MSLRRRKHLRVGFRFERRDAARLQAIADRIERGELAGKGLSRAVFALAADAARTGEPLVVNCTDLLDAQLIASGYSMWGVTPPTIHEISGHKTR